MPKEKDEEKLCFEVEHMRSKLNIYATEYTSSIRTLILKVTIVK